MTTATRPLRVPSVATLADVAARLGYTLRPTTVADRCDMFRGMTLVLRATTAHDAFSWLRQRGEIE
jgi:hypothetical protein